MARLKYSKAAEALLCEQIDDMTAFPRLLTKGSFPVRIPVDRDEPTGTKSIFYAACSGVIGRLP